MKEELIEIVNEVKERATREWKESNAIAHSSYGTGVDWGMIQACEQILEEIEELKN